MTANDNPQPRIRFYQEDFVRRVQDPETTGFVLRCWHDSDDISIPPAVLSQDPLLRPLKRGEVGVSYFPSSHRAILPESDFELLDRMFRNGDLVKKSIEDVRSGVVTSVDVECRVEHAISGARLDRWVKAADIDWSADIAIGDYVIYEDWIGIVQELFDESIVQTSDGNLVRLPEISARLSVGERGSDILPSPTGPPQSILGFFQALAEAARPAATDTVVAVKHTVLAISWMAINQSLPSSEAASRPRPDRFWHGTGLSKLQHYVSPGDQIMHVGDKVILRNPPPDMVTKHGKEGEAGGNLEVATFVVVETRRFVDVMWQDGAKERLNSTELIPYLNPDEYDCWPGDHVVWKTEDSGRPAVIQTVNAQERTATILLADGSTEMASVLELDPHGSEGIVNDTTVSFGSRRGDLVLIHAEGTTNGLSPPLLPCLGELEAWALEPPIPHEDGQFYGWRQEMDKIGTEIAHARGRQPVEEGGVREAWKSDPPLTWFGEVIDLRVDGLIDVALPNSTVISVPLNRITRLNDALEQLEDLWGDGFMDDDLDSEDSMDMDGAMEIQDENGEWIAGGSDEDDDNWEDEDEEMLDAEPEPMTVEVHIDATAKDTLRPPDPVVPTDADAVASASSDKAPSESSGEPLSSPPVIPRAIHGDAGSSSGHASDDEDKPWKRFDILPAAPVDHAFYGTAPAQPSKSFLSRLNKEYRALTHSLPDTIIVRAFEDRTDLLRCLIIGPENTPYEDAPFVIDWMLDSNFPQTPPIAHFLSWTNGNGRVNPNLYEEGKVCLSILGTWAGDQNESWNASRSSLLQAFVSIQGLVLVKEPWFCEPAYEKWRGTEEGIVNSRLYSEKAYVLSRGFVRRALEVPLGGLEDEIKIIYYSLGRLDRVIRHARSLIERSQTPGDPKEVTDLAVPRLTAGGIITLTRVLTKLEAIFEASSGSTPSPSTS